MTADEAEDYHSVQLTTLKQAGVDLAWAFTFNDEDEAIGVARAAARPGVPLAVSFTLTGEALVHSGSTPGDRHRDSRCGDRRLGRASSASTAPTPPSSGRR